MSFAEISDLAYFVLIVGAIYLLGLVLDKDIKKQGIYSIRRRIIYDKDLWNAYMSLL